MIEIVKGDITQACVDAIVNAANPMMLGGGGVDGAIHRAAGPKLLQACLDVPEVDGIRCPVGDARITDAGNLNARFVIHTVGPRYHVDPNPAKLLDRAYRQSLGLAVSHGCASVALPAVSCGVYGYPIGEAASIALAACNDSQFSAMELTFYLFGDEIFQTWSQKLTDLK